MLDQMKTWFEENKYLPAQDFTRLLHMEFPDAAQLIPNMGSPCDCEGRNFPLTWENKSPKGQGGGRDLS
jgi:hypothetical protein